MELLKCPECGNLPVLQSTGGQCKYFCGVHRSCGEWYTDEEFAAGDWNLRASFESELDDGRYWEKAEAPVPEQAARLQAEIAQLKAERDAAWREICYACDALATATGHGWEDGCDECQWRGLEGE